MDQKSGVLNGHLLVMVMGVIVIRLCLFLIG